MTNSLILDKLNSYAENSKFKENIKKVFLWKDKVSVIEFQFLNRRFGIDVAKVGNSLQISTHWRKGSLQYEYFIKEVRTSSFENLFSDLDTIVYRFASFILKNGLIEISVIVPVYNREELIKPLINSLNNQSLDKEKFEVIFIDDGSTDSSVSVIEKFAEINYRIIRRSNGSGSASTPRNEGINNAFGDYLLFIDSDDFFDVDCLRSVINLAKESDADIVYLKTEGLNGRQCSARTFSGKENILKAGIFKNALLMHGFPCKAFRTSLIRDNNILYNPSFKLEEDKLFLFEALALSKNVAILKDKAYVYLTRHEGEHLGRSKEKTKYRVYKLWYMYLMYCLRMPDEIRRKEFYNQLMFRFAVKYSAEISRESHSEDLDLIVKEFKCHLNLFDSKYIYKDGIEQVEKVFSTTGVENIK